MKSVWSRQGIRGLLIVLAACCVAPACAGAGLGVVEDGVPEVARQVVVEVENYNWADIVVYAVRGGHRIRLGMVTSMGSERFVLPSAVVTASTNVQLIADPIGGGAPYVFPPVIVERGQRVELRLENYLGLSSISVW